MTGTLDDQPLIVDLNEPTTIPLNLQSVPASGILLIPHVNSIAAEWQREQVREMREQAARDVKLSRRERMWRIMREAFERYC